MPQKLCKLCNNWKSADEFPSNGTLKCLACKRAEYRQTHRKPEVYHADLTTNTKKCRVSDVKPGYKRCSSCKEQFPATTMFFYSRRSRAKCSQGENRLSSWCKGCRRKYDSLHIENRREYLRLYERKNVQKQKLRRLANLEHHREYNRKSYRKHIDKRRMYRKAHSLQRSVYENKRHARKLSIGGMLTPQQIQYKLKMQHHRCYYAASGHAKFEKKDGKYIYHLEHTIPLSRTEHNPKNDANYVVLACPSCNTKKYNKLPHEWEQGGRLL